MHHGMSTFLAIYPRPLLPYKAQICKFSQKYKSTAWLMYDTTSHDMAASNVSQLYSDIFKEETLLFCFSCHTYGHCTLACPACSKSNQPFCSSTASLPSSVPEPSHLSSSSFKQSPGPRQLQPAAICHDFNECFCWWPNYQFSTSTTSLTLEATMTLSPHLFQSVPPPCLSTFLTLLLNSWIIQSLSLLQIFSIIYSGNATLAT